MDLKEKMILHVLDLLEKKIEKKDIALSDIHRAMEVYTGFPVAKTLLSLYDSKKIKIKNSDSVIFIEKTI